MGKHLIMKTLIVLFLLICMPAFAGSPGQAPGTDSQFLINKNTQYGAAAVGRTMTSAAISGVRTANGSQPADVTNSGTTGSPACKDIYGGNYVTTNASAKTITLPGAATTDCTQGFLFIAKNTGGNATYTCSGGCTINGSSSFVVPPNNQCEFASDGTNYLFNGCKIVPLSAASISSNVTFRQNTYYATGGGSALATGNVACNQVPYSGTITAYSMIADQSGSVAVDIWKRNNVTPTIVNTITASAKPTLSSASSNYGNTTLTGWTTSVAANDVFCYHIDSVSTITWLTVILFITTN